MNGFIFSASRRSDKKELWRRSLPCVDGAATLPLGSRVYVGCSTESDGLIVVLDAADGSVERKAALRLNGVIKLQLAASSTIVVSGLLNGATIAPWTELLDAATLKSKMVQNSSGVVYLGTIGDRAYLDVTGWAPAPPSDVANPPLKPEVIVSESLSLQRESEPVRLLPEPNRHTANDYKVAHLVGSKLYLRVGSDTYLYDAEHLQLPPLRLKGN